MSEFAYDRPATDVASLKRALANNLIYRIGKDPHAAQPHDWLQAAALTVREHMVEPWMANTRSHYAADVKRVYYLSMEFLMGRTFGNALLALDLQKNLSAALAELGQDLDLLAELEPDAALGNGGLGRLAACFLDSMATLGVAGFGYGIRYDYGMFKQQIVDGRQVESPDYWLRLGNAWEFARPEVTYPIRFGGHVEPRQAGQDGTAESGATKGTSVGTSVDASVDTSVGVLWHAAEEVQAMAYDSIVPGYGGQHTNTLRLWSARASEEIDLAVFNSGAYLAAVEQKNHSENVSRVLYPDDSTDSGRELRLKQEYFFCSASMQDLLRRHLASHADFSTLADKVAIHLNDTHPTLAVPELLRLLIDEYHVPWQAAWPMAQQIFSYTNHTLMQEALECWPVALIERLLPRHLQLIYQINAEFLAGVRARHPGEEALVQRVSLIDEAGERRVRMAFLAVVASHQINGVSQLHSDLMTQSIFADFYALFPKRFNNKTNGITPRRWLAHANPTLAELIDQRIGTGWRRDLGQLAQLRPAAAPDAALLQGVRRAKQHNKARLAHWLAQHLPLHGPQNGSQNGQLHGSGLNPAALFDVQVKRIHEYKRQLLNLLYVVLRYQQIVQAPDANWVPRCVIIAGKAASAYHAAKTIIQLANDISATLAATPGVARHLQLFFIPNYSVSLAQLIIPAADLSQQISTAGTEASGTGNMKLALNGALTIGTLDGATVEMAQQIGHEHFFLFGNDSAQVAQLRAQGYRPYEYYQGNPALAAALDAIGNGHFSPQQPNRYRALVDDLLRHDHYQLLADFASYCEAQQRVDQLYRQPEAWDASALANIAGMGPFSSDRTIAEYAQEIWRVPLD
jgi:starch phosphorylase